MKKLLRDLERFLEGKQYPDNINISKQGFIKFWITVDWTGASGNVLRIKIDWTNNYCRILGNVDDIPLYIAGYHRYWDNSTKKELEDVGSRWNMSDDLKAIIIRQIKEESNVDTYKK